MTSIDLTVKEFVERFPGLLTPPEIEKLIRQENKMQDDTDNLPVTPSVFRPGTMNHEIFNLNAPYNNIYQGKTRRLLFVCSAGLLRSPTAAHVATSMGFNTRSCGSNTAYALVPLSANLIMWAHNIIFVNSENHKEALSTFKNTGFEEDIEDKAIVWNIPDNFAFCDPDLVSIITHQLKSDIERGKIQT